MWPEVWKFTSCACHVELAIEWRNIYENQPQKCVSRGEEDSKDSMLIVTWIAFQLTSWNHVGNLGRFNCVKSESRSSRELIRQNLCATSNWIWSDTSNSIRNGIGSNMMKWLGQLGEVTLVNNDGWLVSVKLVPWALALMALVVTGRYHWTGTEQERRTVVEICDGWEDVHELTIHLLGSPWCLLMVVRMPGIGRKSTGNYRERKC